MKLAERLSAMLSDAADGGVVFGDEIGIKGVWPALKAFHRWQFVLIELELMAAKHGGQHALYPPLNLYKREQ